MSINTSSIVTIPINVCYLQFNIVIAHLWGLNGGHNLVLPSKRFSHHSTTSRCHYRCKFLWFLNSKSFSIRGAIIVPSSSLSSFIMEINLLNFLFEWPGSIAWAIQYCWGAGWCLWNGSNRLYLATWFDLIPCIFFYSLDSNRPYTILSQIINSNGQTGWPGFCGLLGVPKSELTIIKTMINSKEIRTL